jgi:hypothetical protein
VSYEAVLNGSVFPGMTFASSWWTGNVYDECNGRADTQSTVMLLYR